MYYQSCTGIIHQTYHSNFLSTKHKHPVYLTECRNMPTDNDLWTPVSYSELPKLDHPPCKLCLGKLERKIGYTIREYCRLFGHDTTLSFYISEEILPLIITHIKGD